MSPSEQSTAQPMTPLLPVILLAITTILSIECRPRPALTSAPMPASSDAGPPSIGRPVEGGSTFEARCALQLWDVCHSPDEGGSVDLCGTGHPPAVGARYVLFDGERVRDDIGGVIIRTVSGEDFEHRIRATGTTSLAWLDAAEGPLGAIGPWDERLALAGGKVVWGGTVTELGVWVVGLTLAFPRGERFELRGQLESCYRRLLETRFLHDGGSCVTESRAEPNEPFSPRTFFIGVPRRCETDGDRLDPPP
jgi:hypothetical protein